MADASNLPYITAGTRGIGGKIREIPSDFIVEEIPIYEPSGTGTHLYVNITKELMTTDEVTKMIARALKINSASIGFAGMKDKHAITTQSFSIPLEKTNEISILEKLKNLPVKINWARPHGNKLKTGHLLGNKFSITITGIDNMERAFDNVNAIAKSISKTGIPNYFGEQRFGIGGDNATKGLQLVRNQISIRDRWMRRFLISSLQSELCNKYLAARLERNLFRIIPGDICKKHQTGGLFESENPEEEQKRYDNHEISFTAPIYGPDMWFAKGESSGLENEILEASGITMEELAKAGIQGTRRLGRLLVNDMKIEKNERGLLVSFSLPKGAFATTVLREIMKC